MSGIDIKSSRRDDLQQVGDHVFEWHPLEGVTHFVIALCWLG